MTSLYNQALMEAGELNISPAAGVTYVNRGSNEISKDKYEPYGQSGYLWEVFKRAADTDNLQGHDLKRLVLANVGNPNFPAECWGVASLSQLDQGNIIMPNLECLKAALFIDVPSQWSHYPNLSSKIGGDDPVQYLCNIGHYTNDYERCVPSLTWYEEQDKTDKNTANGIFLLPDDYQSNIAPDKIVPGKFGPGLKEYVSRKESDEPGVYDKHSKEEGSSTLLYIAGAGILGAIAYVLLRK